MTVSSFSYLKGKPFPFLILLSPKTHVCCLLGKKDADILSFSNYCSVRAIIEECINFPEAEVVSFFATDRKGKI